MKLNIDDGISQGLDLDKIAFLTDYKKIPSQKSA